jgi:hypothetical protein
VFTTILKGRQNLFAATEGLLGAMPSLVPKAMFTLGPSPATAGLSAAMPSLAARAAFAPALSAVSGLAERNGVFRRAGAPASAAEAVFTGEAVFEADATERTQP